MKMPVIRVAHQQSSTHTPQRLKRVEIVETMIKPSSQSSVIRPQESLCRQMCYGDPECLAACPW